MRARERALIEPKELTFPPSHPNTPRNLYTIPQNPLNSPKSCPKTPRALGVPSVWAELPSLGCNEAQVVIKV